MIYLTGVTNRVIEDALIAAGVGLIVTPSDWRSPDVVARFPHKAYDNACYTDRWDEDKWMRWLERQPLERCLFAVSPDVYPNAVASLERGLEFAPILRDMGFPVAIVAQDGAERLDFPWPEFDCLFVGGERNDANPDAEWKLSPGAESLIRRARAAGKWVHMGRVNSLKRMERARLMGCHSADGTFIKKAPNHNVPRAQHWFDWLAMHKPFPELVAFESPSHPNHRKALLS